jgi:hypothetical protein
MMFVAKCVYVGRNVIAEGTVGVIQWTTMLLVECVNLLCYFKLGVGGCGAGNSKGHDGATDSKTDPYHQGQAL